MVPPGISRRPAPEDVRTAGQLWYAALGVGLVQLIASLLAQFGQRHELAQQMFDQVKDREPTVTLAQVQVWTVVVFVVVAVFWLVLTGAGVAVVYQLGRGKNWARALLTGFGVFLVIGAVSTLFGIGVKEGVAALVAGGAGIVQAVLACGAVFLCYRSESEAFFRPPAR
ncbi:hypothetical protein D7D52_06385 [Nocardia yunnanensis]|uniref:Uncharacterized protein n=1 Tax=Nocardia yunnanensis TaxID=2382165 RepID=A0A386ZN75_9NOCA|nr:hypothetical protein [Nocardia yunnanensis]AYF78783.1 hypothetical protein D7D52_06385 [Nocardia yunnanensis]